MEAQAVDQSKFSPPASGNVIDPGRLQYTGAFRLPGEEERPRHSHTAATR